MSKFSQDLAMVLITAAVVGTIIVPAVSNADPQPSKLDKLITKYYQVCKYDGSLASDLGFATGTVAWHQFCLQSAHNKALIETNDSNINSVE